MYHPNTLPKEDIVQFTIFTTVHVTLNRGMAGSKWYIHKMEYCEVNKKNDFVFVAGISSKTRRHGNEG